MNRFVTSLVAAATLALAASPLAAQTDTTFTYQGTLDDQGAPANGSFNLDFGLFDALIGGNQIGSSVMFNGHPVVEGLFTVELDFGASAFDNSNRWIEIAVNGSQLSPRQPITRAPYSIQTRGIFVDDTGDVGIGTTTPNYPLHVESDGTIAIYGQNSSISGRGVFGWATATTGFTSGGRFQNSSTSGRGVYGSASANTGATYGVFGQSSSTSGHGVYGEATASSGTTYGVRGRSKSTFGLGVYGEATASTGITYGGRFESSSTSGRGVFAWARASTGITDGIRGQSASTAGRGVFGWATAATGITDGVRGQSSSTSGRGVFGEASAVSGTTYGVRGQNDSVSGFGVYGQATATTGTTYGAYGRSDSSTGRGTYGFATHTTGVNYGVVGRSQSPNGFDFFASGAGTNYGAFSSRRWKSNVVPISDPLQKLAQLRGVYFDWDKEHGGQHDLGMIAEEVGEILPEIVQYEENGIDAIGMDYSKMTPLLVEAVNALRNESDRRLAEKDDEISELREAHAAEIDDLRRQLSDLQQIVERLASNQEKENAQ